MSSILSKDEWMNFFRYLNTRLFPKNSIPDRIFAKFKHRNYLDKQIVMITSKYLASPNIVVRNCKYNFWFTVENESEIFSDENRKWNIIYHRYKGMKTISMIWIKIKTFKYFFPREKGIWGNNFQLTLKNQNKLQKYIN